MRGTGTGLIDSATMRRLPILLALLLFGCGIFGEDEDIEPPPPDPALAPAPVLPAPVVTPTTGGGATTTPSAGTFTIPGLEGVSIPLPAAQGAYHAPEPPARGTLAAAPPQTYDTNGHMTRAFLEQRAEVLHQALVTALDAHENGQVREIPFEVVDERSEPNAAAGCTNGEHPVMMITAAMLELAAGIAEAKAYDEAAGTETMEQYVTSVVAQVRAHEVVQGVNPALHQAPHALDPHKLARQVHLFDQQVAFILGHELAHHYRGHTNCVAGRSDEEVRRDELSRILAHTIPPFSQPREVEADMWGLTNVLEAGYQRQGGTWTEEGAMLNLDFFRRLSDRGGAELIMAFLSTHPPSIVRIPIVRSTAQQWSHGWRPPRMPVPGAAGGEGIEIPTPGGPIRLPGNLPIDPSQFPIPFPFPTQPQGSTQ